MNAAGAVTMVDGTVVDAGSASIDVDASEDITLGSLITTNIAQQTQLI